MAIHLARHTYDPSRPFRPWMFAIVRHKTIDILRKQRSRAQAADQYTREQAVLSQAAATPGPGRRRRLAAPAARPLDPHPGISNAEGC